MLNIDKEPVKTLLETGSVKIKSLDKMPSKSYVLDKNGKRVFVKIKLIEFHLSGWYEYKLLISK